MKCWMAYPQLYNISKIRKYLHRQSAEQLIHIPVHNHIDYCNVLLTGLPKYIIKKLQMTKNTAARVLCRVGKNEHITPTFKRLHWSPGEFHIKYKVCLLTFNTLHGLRSCDALTLNVSRTKQKTLGDCFQSLCTKIDFILYFFIYQIC